MQGEPVTLDANPFRYEYNIILVGLKLLSLKSMLSDIMIIECHTHYIFTNLLLLVRQVRFDRFVNITDFSYSKTYRKQ